MSGHDNPDEPTLAGEYGPVKPADSRVQAAFDQVKAQFLAQSGVNATTPTVMAYREQDVPGQGSNFVFRVQYTVYKYADLQYVHTPFPRIEYFDLDKTEEDKIEPLKH